MKKMRGRVFELKIMAKAVGCRRAQLRAWAVDGVVDVVDGPDEDLIWFRGEDIQMLRDKVQETLAPEDQEVWAASLPHPATLESHLVGEEEAEDFSEEDIVPAARVAQAALTTRYRKPIVVGPGHGEPCGEIAKIGPIELVTVAPAQLHPEAAAQVPQGDPNYKMSPGEAVLLAAAVQHDIPAWLYGPTGSGKTTGVLQMAALANWPLWRLQMSEDMSLEDFVGGTELSIDEQSGQAVSVNVDGFLKQAMIHGGILLIDEVTATPAHVLMCLQAVLERTPGQPPRLVDSRTSEIVEAHPRFRVIVSDNTNGQGDVTRSYQGTNVMNEAFRNRFGLWMDKTYPEPSAWSEILQTKTKVLPAVADQIVKIAGIVNSGSAMLGAPGGTVTCNSVVSPRDTLNVARLAVILGQLKAAFQMGLIKAMHKENPDRQFIEDTIRNVLGGAA